MTRLAYPPAARLDLVEDTHGYRVPDPYRWLEDPEDVETKRWLDAQDELCHDMIGVLPGRERLRDRIRELLGAGSVSPPVWRADRRFFLRRAAEQEFAVLYTVGPHADPDDPAVERRLIDPAELDLSGTTTLDAWQPDKEGRLFAYQLSHGGDEESILRVMDVATSEIVDGPIDRCKYSPIAWIPGGEAFYYVRRLPPDQVPEGEEQYHRRVYLHRVGTAPDDDVMVFGDGRDKTEYYGVSVSPDGRWLVVSAARGTAPRNDLWIADLPEGPLERPLLRMAQEDVDARSHAHVGRDGRLYVFTDRDAPRGRLCVADPADPGYASWRPLLAERPDAVLRDFAILDGSHLEHPLLLAGWTRHAVSEITVHDLGTGERVGTVPTPGLGSIGGIAERYEGGHEAWFAYTDHTTPVTVLRYDARSGDTTTWATPPGAVEVPRVQARQVTYASADGTPVRMFVVSRPDVTGPRPTVLYGYGGFGISLTPAYSASILAWVEAGGTYVVANLRGGGEEGEEWHRAGMLDGRQRVFEDFRAGAERLIAHGWTTPARLGISGGSNGGLLVGAALTQRPSLYAAVVCSAPLLDMVRYERFGLGALWSAEYGSATDPEQLGHLLEYSPYHNVREGVDYPSVLFTVFDGDSRVDQMHARKMCAALQHSDTDHPVVVRRESEAGHSVRAVSRTVDLAADTLAFLAAHTGLAVPES